jgi:hypothetical protein
MVLSFLFSNLNIFFRIGKSRTEKSRFPHGKAVFGLSRAASTQAFSTVTHKSAGRSTAAAQYGKAANACKKIRGNKDLSENSFP